MDYGYKVPGELVPPSDPAHWPAGHGYDSDRGSNPTVTPEQIGEVLEHLVRKGYSDSDLALIKGENMLRVAGAVWKPAAA